MKGLGGKAPSQEPEMPAVPILLRHYDLKRGLLRQAQDSDRKARASDGHTAPPL